MNNSNVLRFCTTTFVVVCLVLATDRSVHAAPAVEARLSTENAFVGQPILLQIIIRDAASYSVPDPPTIDGLSIESVGPESTSIQTTIINGRSQTFQTAIVSYRVIPERPGKFTIPEIPIKINGTELPTTPLSFEVTISETGDLLFVDLHCDQSKVYVGQSVSVTLRFWIKPYYDKDFDLTLGESEMWSRIAEQTNWGPFSETIDRLRSQRRRPGGREVTRDNGQGQSQRYLLYEIDTNLVPSRPGSLLSDEVKVVFDYPTELGRSRDPIEDFFQGTPFGGSSPLSRLLDEDDRIFSGRLHVVASRPIAASPEKTAVDVVPVPSEGRPASYRGAVGDFTIRAQSTTQRVSAGDPIEMTIAIGGSGALDLVQPPPLAEQSNLTNDFKVSDQPIGGYVKDDTKYFGTSIRPLNERVDRIPPIEFSFFDPETETFRTVTSDPIPITVDEAETLTLPGYVPTQGADTQPTTQTPEPGSDWSHEVPLEWLLAAPIRPDRFASKWFVAAVIPPLAWLVVFGWMHRRRLVEAWARRNPVHAAQQAIAIADSPVQIVDCLIRYVERRFGAPSASSTWSVITAAGTLRLAGHYNHAATLESLSASLDERSDLDAMRDAARQWIQSVERSRNGSGRQRSVAAAMMVVVLSMPNALATPPAIAIDAIKQAQADYANGKFDAAAEQYQMAIDSGIDNAILRRFLADTQFRAGKTASAVANYHAAKLYDPHDGDTLQHLQLVDQTLTPLSINGRTNVEREADGSLQPIWDSTIATPQSIMLLVAVNMMAWTWVVARTLRRKQIWIFMFPAIGATSLLMASLWTYGHQEKSGTIVFLNDKVTVRSGDGEGFESIAELASAAGHIARMTGQRAGWVQIQLPGGMIGWVDAKSILPVRPASHPVSP